MMRERSIGPTSRNRFRGCRIGHEIQLGAVGLQIRGGATPPNGRDERVQFLLMPEDLDEMIVCLSAIRAELQQIEHPDAIVFERMPSCVR